MNNTYMHTVLSYPLLPHPIYTYPYMYTPCVYTHCVYQTHVPYYGVSSNTPMGVLCYLPPVLPVLYT